MNKNEYIKYLLDYLFAKQKNFLRGLEQENKTDRISYYRGGLADTIDMMGFLVSEYKRDYDNESKPIFTINSKMLTIELTSVYHLFSFKRNRTIESLSDDEKIEAIVEFISKNKLLL